MKIKLAKSEIVHFIGIGGIGMSGLSLIMKGKGFKVQGSDLVNNKNIFSGGFLGVDIFLVVSGFLITRIINNEYLYEKNFTFKNFYERRFRRLVPALLIVIIFSTSEPQLLAKN